jgi:hypothetical protein
MLVEDLNADGAADILVVGNNYSNSVFWGPIDALNGLVMLGDGKGGFNPMEYNQSGFFVPGDGRKLVSLKHVSGRQLYIASQNRDSLRVFELIK